MGAWQRRAGRRRQGDRALLDRLGNEAGDGRCDRVGAIISKDK